MRMIISTKQIILNGLTDDLYDNYTVYKTDLYDNYRMIDEKYGDLIL